VHEVVSQNLVGVDDVAGILSDLLLKRRRAARIDQQRLSVDSDHFALSLANLDREQPEFQITEERIARLRPILFVARIEEGDRADRFAIELQVDRRFEQRSVGIGELAIAPFGRQLDRRTRPIADQRIKPLPQLRLMSA
jgi:hypothetical protein